MQRSVGLDQDRGEDSPLCLLRSIGNLIKTMREKTRRTRAVTNLKRDVSDKARNGGCRASKWFGCRNARMSRNARRLGGIGCSKNEHEMRRDND